MTSEAMERFRQQVLCHLDVVYRMAYKLCGTAHDAEDLTQETILRAHRAFGQFELREYGAKPWLLKILYNLYLNHRGQASKSPSLMTDLSLDDFVAELTAGGIPSLSDGRMNWEGFDEELKQAIEALSPEYRAVLLLWALGDLTYREIGEVLGCALGTVMSRLHRARQQLSEQLAEYATRRGIRVDPS